MFSQLSSVTRWNLCLLLPVTAMLAIITRELSPASFYVLAKPLPLLVLIAAVVSMQRQLPGPAANWLLAGLAASWTGDVLLLWRGGFLAGLVAFLLAHMAYLRMLHTDSTWPRWQHPAIVLLALLGLGTYVMLWRGGMPESMRWPVAFYILVIVTMTMQATWRALQGRPAGTLVAAGAWLFLCSDTLLAYNRFVDSLGVGSFLILTTYFLAQWCIVTGMLHGWQHMPPAPEKEASSA